MVVICESGLEFGQYEEKNFFRIENSSIQKSAGDKVKTVEFVMLKQSEDSDSVIFLEAKSSCPNAANTSDDNKKNYENFFTEITAKFYDSVNMFAAAVMQRYPGNTEIGANLLNTVITKNYRMRLVLVISSAELIWLPGPKAELEQRLLKLRRIWKCDVAVLNTELARKQGLLVQNL